MKPLNPYPKSKPRQWNAWKVGYRDAASTLRHDPLGRGFRELSVAMAYTRGCKTRSVAKTEHDTP